MYLEVEIDSSPAVRLRAPHDFKAFKVVVQEGVTEAELATALAPYARVLAGGDVMVRIESLKELSGELGRESHWLAELRDMIAYAGSKGWLSDDSGSIRAHCERRATA